MNQADEFRYLMWESKLAVRIQLDNKLNVSNEEVIPPLYIYIYRQQYVLFYYKQIWDHFKDYIVKEQNILKMYLEMFGQKLSNNVPFGVLYDILRNDDEELYTPLNLTIKFDNQNDSLLCTQLNDEIYHQFVFNIKQSVLAKFKHGNGLNMLFQYLDNQKKNEFIEKIQYDDERFQQNLDWIFNIYDNVQQYLYIDIFDIKQARLIYFPLRIYIRNQKCRFQQVIKIENNDETIGQVIKSILPDLEYEKIVFNGIKLDENIPAIQFYIKFYSLDGFSYFTIVLK